MPRLEGYYCSTPEDTCNGPQDCVAGAIELGLLAVLGAVGSPQCRYDPARRSFHCAAPTDCR
jgi:hypothetical protein